MPAWAWTAAETARDQILAAGIPILVIDYNAQTVEKHVASTLAIGAAMGTPDRAAALADRYRRNHGDIVERAARAASGAKPRVHLELDQGGAEVVGNSYSSRTMWGRIFAMLDVQNIAEGRVPGAYAPIAAEAVLALRPWNSSSSAPPPGPTARARCAPATTSRRKRRDGHWPPLPAAPRLVRPVRDPRGRAARDRARPLPHALRRPAAMLYMAKRFWPGAFERDDPVAALAECHARFLPAPFSGTWMVKWQA